MAERLRGADPEAPRPEGIVLCDYFWITDGDESGVPRAPARADAVAAGGGRPHRLLGASSRRREGHASRAVALALIRAKELGLERVLLTCDEDNVGSRLTIENAGGVYEDSRRARQAAVLDRDR